MRLSFQSTFLSIKEFPSVDVPRFTLITGLNGTGKSHLLKAIVGQQIRSDEAPNPAGDVRFFDWTNMVPNDTGPFDGHTFIQEQNGMYEQFFNARRSHEDQIIAAARGAGLTGRTLSNVSEIALLSFDDLRTLLGSDDAATAAQQSIKSAVDATSSNLLGNIGASFHAKSLPNPPPPPSACSSPPAPR